MADDAGIYVVRVNFPAKLALLADGRDVPVTNMLDCDGDETPDFNECARFVCGPLPAGSCEGKWIAVDMAGFEPVKAN